MKEQKDRIDKRNEDKCKDKGKDKKKNLILR
jgi:hypothetical protein